MANSKKTVSLTPTPDCGRALAVQFLNDLRRKTITAVTKECSSELEALVLAEKLGSSIRLPIDKAAYAVALAYCLSPRFSSLEELSATKAFAVIRCRAGDDADAVSEVLISAIPHDAGQIAHNPQYGLHLDERLVVIGDAGVRYTGRMLWAVAQAAKRCLPVFCILEADDPIPRSLADAELVLELPPLTAKMLTLLFEVAHDMVPPGVSTFKSAEKLRIEDLVAHIRRRRPVEECLSGLQLI